MDPQQKANNDNHANQCNPNNDRYIYIFKINISVTVLLAVMKYCKTCTKLLQQTWKPVVQQMFA